MRLPEKQQLIIFGVSVAVIVSFGVFRCIPLIKERAEAKSAKIQNDAVNAGMQAKIVQVPSLRKKVQQLQSELGKYDRRKLT